MSLRRHEDRLEREGRVYALLLRLPIEWQTWWHDPLICRRLFRLIASLP